MVGEVIGGNQAHGRKKTQVERQCTEGVTAFQEETKSLQITRKMWTKRLFEKGHCYSHGLIG